MKTNEISFRSPKNQFFADIKIKTECFSGGANTTMVGAETLDGCRQFAEAYLKQCFGGRVPAAYVEIRENKATYPAFDWVKVDSYEIGTDAGKRCVYQVTALMHADTSVLFETESLAAARARYDKEVADATAADVTGWPDHDEAWNTVHRIELNRIAFDEEGEVADVESVELSDYFEL